MDFLQEITPQKLQAHVERLSGIRHEQACPQGLQRALGYLREQFQLGGLQVYASPFDPPGDQFPNLVGVVSGQTRPEETLIVGAHYDTVSVSPGADDNASGLSVMLAALGVLGAHPGECSVEFVAFSQEEQGLAGSTAYARAAKVQGRRILGAVVLECVGYTDHHPGAQGSPPGLPIALPETGDFIGLVANVAADGICRSFQKALSVYAPALSQVSLFVPGEGLALPDTRRSDHAPFWDEGFPAMMITDTADFRNPHYHQPSDVPQTLDYSFMTQLARALAGFCHAF